MSVDNLLKKVLDRALEDDRIRVVMLNGSRANLKGDIDAMSDVDIVYYVSDYESIIKEHAFFTSFGDVLISQEKSEQLFPEISTFLGYIYMMQFKDGTRLDLSVVSVNDLNESIQSKDYYKVLLDKDSRTESMVLPNTDVFTISKPSKAYFQAAVKQFYWVSVYVIKGVNRKMYPYAVKHLDILREALEAMISWYIGCTNDWNIELGKAGRHYAKYLSEEQYALYIESFALANKASIYKALSNMMRLFKAMNDVVSEAMKYEKKVDHEVIVRYLEEQSDFKS